MFDFPNYSGFRRYSAHASTEPHLPKWSDFRRCSTLFDFPRGYRCSVFAELVGFPKIISFDSTPLITEDDRERTIFLEVTEDNVFVELVGFPKMVLYGSNRFSELVGFPKIFYTCFERARLADIVGLPKMFDTIRFPRG